MPAAHRLSRRAALGWALGLAACAELPEGVAPVTSSGSPVPPGPAGEFELLPWRTLRGGFLMPPGAAARPGSGIFVQLLSPAALALAGQELLVLDRGTQRLWRADVALTTFTPVAGAPTDAGVALALGPDRSAWVLDAAARQVLRFSREGRLLQTLRAGSGAQAPRGLALLDGGARVLVADTAQGQWLDLRGGSGAARGVELRDAAGQRLPVQMEALAVAGGEVFVLDRAAGKVHRAGREGEWLATLDTHPLRLPAALAVLGLGRVFVAAGDGRELALLQPGRAARTWTAAQLRVQAVGALAADEEFLAVADPLGGQVQVLRWTPGARP